MLRPYEEDYANQQARRLGSVGRVAAAEFVREYSDNEVTRGIALEVLMNALSEA